MIGSAKPFQMIHYLPIKLEKGFFIPFGIISSLLVQGVREAQEANCHALCAARDRYPSSPEEKRKCQERKAHKSKQCFLELFFGSQSQLQLWRASPARLSSSTVSFFQFWRIFLSQFLTIRFFRINLTFPSSRITCFVLGSFRRGGRAF